METTGDGRQLSHGGARTEEIIDGLNDLLQLDHDAIGAYEVAIERLENMAYVRQIQGFLRDHQRHVEELNKAIAALGGTPENSPHVTGVFKKALQAVASPAGDKALLVAWRINEAQVRTKYDSYASRANAWPADVKALVDRNALDEENHHQWVVQTLAGLGVGSGAGLEEGMANRAREQAAAARASAGQMAFTARNRIADALDATAERLENVSDGQATNGSTVRQRAARAASGTAHGLEEAAGMLRRGDVDQVRAATERWAGENPAQSIAITFAAGFLLGRLIR
jgi:ElaB/YqjD/DUF883 family membrane-anchored ribosome-binding protein